MRNTFFLYKKRIDWLSIRSIALLVEVRGIEPLSKHNPSKASTVYLIELI